MSISKDLEYNILNKIFKNHKIHGVIHLASLKAVNDSISKPLDYYDNNFNSSLDLIRSMEQFKINKLIFSSSATVYGTRHQSPLRESLSLSPNNPYGNTKLLIEKLIQDYASSNKKFKSISLRYFNPIGSNVSTGLSDQPLGSIKNLIPVILNCIQNKTRLEVFGKIYKTRDGTCIRDYIHVQDVAEAHINALKFIHNIKGHIPINLGLGKGITVLEMIRIFEKVNKVKINFKYSNRRKGDADISFANNNLAKKILNWSPKYNYHDMVKDAWQSRMVR